MNQHKNNSDLIGVWKLLQYTTTLNDSTKIHHPYGEHPTGYLIYTIEGFMSVHIMHSNRTSKISPLEEKIEASENFGGYAGPYIISENTVTHYPEVAGFLAYLQKPQVRYFQIMGNVLTLDYHHLIDEHNFTQTSEKRARSKLIWERIVRNQYAYLK